jgi:hypothetical protein
MKRPIILLPIRVLFRIGETGLRIVLFLFGFSFKAAGFFINRFAALTIGAVIGMLLGRKHIGVKIFNGKKK